MSNSYKFYSILATPIKGYISEKRAVGYKFEKGTAMLQRFDTYVHSHRVQKLELTKEIVINWGARRSNETVITQNTRISLLRGLAKYMNRIGYSAYVYPRAMVTIDRYVYMPYIFTRDEIKKIFEVCDCYPPSKSAPNRHLILPLLFRILYGCGLRISEALTLTIKNVNFDRGTLYIQDAKFGKERILPMADSLTQRCRDYYNVADIKKHENSFLFPSSFGKDYCSGTIYQLFRKILHQAGISHLGRGKGPRIHDMRHTFAVNCLKKWVLEGRNLNNCLPYLSVYLGHEDMRGSQRYLRLTADLYPDIICKIEKHCSYIIPEVEIYEAD